MPIQRPAPERTLPVSAVRVPCNSWIPPGRQLCVGEYSGSATCRRRGRSRAHRRCRPTTAIGKRAVGPLLADSTRTAVSAHSWPRATTSTRFPIAAVVRGKTTRPGHPRGEIA